MDAGAVAFPVPHGPAAGRRTSCREDVRCGSGDGLRPRRCLAGQALARLGHEVAVIDRDETVFTGSPWFPRRADPGHGLRPEVLLRAGIERLRRLRRVSSGDNSNIISARVAREMFSVKRVVARIYDAKRAAVYERLGIPTVATVPWTTDRLLNVLTYGDATTRWRDRPEPSPSPKPSCNENWVGRPATDLETATGARWRF